MTLNDGEWKKKLTPERYRVLRGKGTEPPFSGEYVHNSEKGVYMCAGCGAELFSDSTKFDSGSGWPSFYDAIDRGRIEEIEDTSHGMRRIEIVCRGCKGHLGHVFPDGPRPTGLRYCVNSLSLDFRKDGPPPEE
jgi:methionine-R-sulfoxide reductase